MYKKVRCTCEVVVLLIKPIVFLTFSLSSASSDLKVPINRATRAVHFVPIETVGFYFSRQGRLGRRDFVNTNQNAHFYQRHFGGKT